MAQKSRRSKEFLWAWETYFRYLSHVADGLFSVCAECSIIGLTVIDALAITAELLIDLKLIQDPNKVSTSDGKTSNNGGTDGVTKPVLTEDNTTVPINPGGLSSDFTLNDSDALTLADGIIHYLSVFIASLFIIEILFKFIVKPKFWALRKLQVFDIGVVILLFAMELVFSLLSIPYASFEAFTYIVLLRLWRTPFVCNRRLELKTEEMTSDMAFIEGLRLKESENNKQLEKTILKQKKEIEELKKCIENYKREREKVLSGENDLPDLPVINEVLPEEKVTLAQFAERATVKIIQNATKQVVKMHEHDSTDGARKTKLSNGFIKSNIDSDSVSDVIASNDSDPLDRGMYARTGSESSLDDIHPSSHEVKVDIEEGHRDAIVTESDKKKLLQASPNKTSQFAYVNSGFNGADSPDLDNEEMWQIMAEIDGTKTYRSLEGLPTTSL